MKAQVNLSQVLQGGLAALVGWLFKTVDNVIAFGSLISVSQAKSYQLVNNSNGFWMKSIKSLCFNILDILSIKMYIYILKLEKIGI